MKRVLLFAAIIISLSVVSAMYDSSCFWQTNGNQTESCNGKNYCYNHDCCGDDANEKWLSQKMGSCGMASDNSLNGVCVTSDDKGCVFAIPNSAKPACWLPNQVGAYDNSVYYYGEGKLMGWDIGTFYGRADWYSCMCENNTWVEASDNNKNLCEAGIGVAKTLTYLNPVPKNVWMENFCCGDDCFEFYKIGSDGTSACCNSSEKVVAEGKCYDDIHDVEINATAPSNATEGENIEVKTKVKNKGGHNEEVKVEFSVENEANTSAHQETKTISLNIGETKEVNFIWKAITGVYNFIVRAKIDSDENLIDNEVIKGVTVAMIPYQCVDSDGGLNYEVSGKASLQISSTRIRSYVDGCKASSTDFLGDFDNNIGPGGGPVIKNQETNYLYEAVCENNKPAMKIKECECYNGICIE